MAHLVWAFFLAIFSHSSYPRFPFSHWYVVFASRFSRWIKCYFGHTNPKVFLAMFPTVVTDSISHALTFCSAFIDFFLVNSLVCCLPYLGYDLSPGCCWFLFDLSRRLFCCLVYPFIFGGILWFLSCCVACWGAFRFWATVPKEFPLSFRLSSRASSSLTALRSASNHSLSSMYSSCMDIRLIASAGTSSSTIFLKAIPVTFARLFFLSISGKNLSISPLYLIWYSSRRALTSSWVGPNRQMTWSLNIFHCSYPSCLV